MLSKEESRQIIRELDAIPRTTGTTREFVVKHWWKDGYTVFVYSMHGEHESEQCRYCQKEKT